MAKERLCVNCHKNSILDKVKFTVQWCVISKFLKGDVCVECEPILLEKYKEELKTLNKTDKNRINRASQQQNYR